MQRLITEFIGTFFLVLTICLAVAIGSPMAALAIGTVLMAMVYMGGTISGAHYNPAVTLALAIRGGGAFAWKDVGPYMLAQVLGSLAAAGVGFWLAGRVPGLAPNPEASLVAALVVEVLFTFALALVVLNVATAPKNAGNGYFGVAIGFIVFAGAVAGGPISGGAFNPAVGVGMLVMRLLTDTNGEAAIGHLWLYLAGPFAGGALAATVFRVQHAREVA